MTKIELLENQIDSDTAELEKDIEDGTIDFKEVAFTLNRIGAKLSKVWKLKNEAHCPKCGDKVLGDEEGLCYRCV